MSNQLWDSAGLEAWGLAPDFPYAFLGWVQKTAYCSIASGEALAGVLGHTGLELFAQLGVIEMLAD